MAHTVSDNPFTPRFSFPFTVPEGKRTTRQVAQRCPICEGRCSVPASLYQIVTDIAVADYGADPDSLTVECRSCWGRGVVYVSESTG